MKLASLSNLFKSVGDPLRLRMLHLLGKQELTVGELVRILELPQSTVSRHLKTLKEQGLLADRPEGTATYYHASLEADLGNGDTAMRDALLHLLGETPLPPSDAGRLERVMALRERAGEDFFDRLGHRWDALRESCFGPSLHFEALLRLLPAEWTVADLGTGTGYLLPVLARHFKRVVGIDQSEAMLGLAERNVAQAQLANVDLRVGQLERLPMADAELDLALAFLMFHHLADVESALHEIHRALKPGGKVLVIEIHPHANERFRVQMGDRRPGIEPELLTGWLTAARFNQIRQWNFPHQEHPEHELAPLPRLYGLIAEKSGTQSASKKAQRNTE